MEIVILIVLVVVVFCSVSGVFFYREEKQERARLDRLPEVRSIPCYTSGCSRDHREHNVHVYDFLIEKTVAYIYINGERTNTLYDCSVREAKAAIDRSFTKDEARNVNRTLDLKAVERYEAMRNALKELDEPKLPLTVKPKGLLSKVKELVSQ